MKSLKNGHFILMADIVDSSDKEGDKLMQDFKALIKVADQNHKQQIISPLTITLGDEFQGVVNNEKNAVEIIFDIEEQLPKQSISYRLRYVLHYGEIDTPLNEKRAHEMLGEGLTIARRTLNSMKKDRRRFFISIPGEKRSRRLNSLFLLYQSIVDDWTEKQKKVAAAFITHKDYKKVAKVLKKDISLAWKLEKSLKIKEYFELKSLILDLLNDMPQ